MFIATCLMFVIGHVDLTLMNMTFSNNAALAASHTCDYKPEINGRKQSECMNIETMHGHGNVHVTIHRTLTNVRFY